MRHLLSDLRFGLRLLRSAPLASAAAVLSLALGIGGTTVMFSVVDGVLLRPLPFAEPDRLVQIASATDARPRFGMAPADFIDMRRAARSFEGMASILGTSMSLTGDGVPEQVRVETVSGTFFTILRATPVAGRLFRPADDAPGTEAQVVIGEGLWRRRYGADPDVVGRTTTLAGRSVVIVGVAPAGFRYESRADLWLLGDRGVPRFSQIPGDLTENRDVHFLVVVARLRPGVPLPTAQAELDGIAARLEREHPKWNTGVGVRVEPLKTAFVGETSPVLFVLLGAVALLLLIAMVNVANLLLVRTQARTLELTMRAALGAPRGRLAGQILAESVLVAGLGGLLGVALAGWGVDAVVALAPAGLPRLDEVAVNGRLLLFAAVLTMAIGVAFGSWPAWRASSTTLSTVLRGETRSTGTRERRRAQRLLVSAELAVAQVLLVGACLLVASFSRLMAVDTGFNPAGLVAVDVSLPGTRYAEPSRKAAFHDAVLARLAALPGVERAAMAMRAPMSAPIERGVWIEGRPEPRPGDVPTMSYLTVSEGYFAATGVAVRRGRALTARDSAAAPTVVVVNETFVRQNLAGADPIGQRIGFGDRTHPGYWRTIVGVVADTRDRPAQPARPTAYAPFRQDQEPWNFASFIVKTARPVETVGEEVRRAVLDVDRDQPISRVRTIAADLQAAVAVPRFTTLLASLFAGLALVLAAVGTFGVMSQIVTARTRELGVRMALGATNRHILRLVLGQTAPLVLGAAGAGMAMALLFGQVLQGLLYEVRAGDPTTLATAAATLVGAGLLASYLPVRRMLARNPLGSLRSD